MNRLVFIPNALSTFVSMKNRTLLTVLLTIIIFHSSCEEPTKPAGSQSNDYIDKTVDYVVKNKDNHTLELLSVYDTLCNQIPEDKDEVLLLSTYLKKKGFKIIDWGRGNYPPLAQRIVSEILQKDHCFCEVNKIYYKTITDTLLEMRERIRCSDSIEFYK